MASRAKRKQRMRTRPALNQNVQLRMTNKKWRHVTAAAIAHVNMAAKVVGLGRLTQPIVSRLVTRLLKLRVE